MCPRNWSVWLMLGGAVSTEVAATLLLHASAGFTRPMASAGVLAGYAVSILLFSRVLQSGIALGVAYGTLTGCGLLAATLFGALLFHDPVTLAQAVGLVLIGVGALALQRRARVASR